MSGPVSTALVRLSLFGGFQARLQSGEEILLPTHKARAVLARLALPAGEAYSRDKLASLFWSDRADMQARASLRQALTGLRKALRSIEPCPLIARGGSIQLDPHLVDVDVTRFEALSRSELPRDLERAVALYNGPLLDGADVRDQAFRDWLVYERDRLQELLRRALTVLLADYAAQGHTDLAIPTAQRLVGLDPLQEDACRALMRLYAETGQRARALKHYQQFSQMLVEELGIEPEAETKQLYDDIRDRRNIAPPPRPTVPKAPLTDPPSPIKPSIAVLPFANLSDDPGQAYFSDGITEDIITQISRFPTVLVIARNSSFAQRDKSEDVTAVARALGVHFVVEGSVRRTANHVRVNVQLVDGVTGHHLWAEYYDRDLADLFVVQDEVTQTIVSTLAGRLEVVGRRYAKRKRTENLEAYDYVLRGNEHFYAFTKTDNDAARGTYQRAVQLDPDCARGHLGLARAELMGWMCHWTEFPSESLDHALVSATNALRCDDSDSLTHAILGEIYLFRRDYEQAVIHLERALSLNRNDADAIGIMGFLLTCLGRPEEGIQHFRTAKRLNPYQPDWCMFCWRFGIAQYTAGSYETAVTCMKEIVSPINDVRGWLAASYAQAGKLGEARRALEEFLRVAETEAYEFPGRTLAAWTPHWAKFYPYRDRADLEHALDGLRKAGLS